MSKPKAPTVEKLTVYRATSADGKYVANGKTQKEALALLNLMMAQ